MIQEIGVIREDKISITYTDITDLDDARVAAYAMFNANRITDKSGTIDELVWINNKGQQCYKFEWRTDDTTVNQNYPIGMH